jgi:hypothetical protein
MSAQAKRPARAGIVVVNRPNRHDMTPSGSFGASRRHATARADMSPAAADEARKLRAALEQIDECGEIRDFAGRRHEKLALITFAKTRGLIAWQNARRQHELTPAGRKWLIAHGGVAHLRRRKFPARMVAAALGVTVLAGAWFSANASYQMFSPASRPATAFRALPQGSPSASRYARATLDSDTARGENSAAVRHPLALIQSDAPIYAATGRAGAGKAQVAEAEPSKPSKPVARVAKSATKPTRKLPRVFREWGDDHGSAMAFSLTDRGSSW